MWDIKCEKCTRMLVSEVNIKNVDPNNDHELTIRYCWSCGNSLLLNEGKGIFEHTDERNIEWMMLEIGERLANIGIVASKLI